MKNAWIGEFILLAAIWGSSFLFMRLGATEFGALALAGLRVGFAALFLLPIMFWSGHWAALRQHWKPIFVAGVFNSALPFALFSYAVMTMNTGLAAILNATAPLFGALVAWAWLKQQPSRSAAAGLMLGFIGVALLTAEKSSVQLSASFLPMLACLGATLCYGIGANYTRHYLKGVPALALATGSQIGATLVLIIPTALWWPEHSPSFRAWGAAIAIALLCTSLAYVIFFKLIDRAGANTALTITFVTPIFAMLYGWLWLDERVSAWMLFCGFIIVCGTALSAGLLTQVWNKLNRKSA